GLKVRVSPPRLIRVPEPVMLPLIVALEKAPSTESVLVPVSVTVPVNVNVLKAPPPPTLMIALLNEIGFGMDNPTKGVGMAIVPPSSVKVPVPREFGVLSSTVPELRVVPPE